MGRKPKQQPQPKVISHEIRKSIIAVVIVMLAIIFFLSLIGKAGIVGQYIDLGLAQLFGWGRYVFPIFMLLFGIEYFRIKEQKKIIITSAGLLFLFITTEGLLQIFTGDSQIQSFFSSSEGGGLFGYITAYPLEKYLGNLAAPIVLFSFWLVGLMLTFNFPILKLYEWFREKASSEREEGFGDEEPVGVKKDKTDEQAMEDNIKSIEFVEGPVQHETEDHGRAEGQAHKPKPKKNIYSDMKWMLPSLSLLEENEDKIKPGNLKENEEIIKRTLHNFGIEVDVGGNNVGPTVTQYTFKPAIGVKLSKILSYQNDLALALAAHPIRIEAPIPGKSLIGVEVPNRTKSLVRMRTMLESSAFRNRASNLTIALGEDVNGQVITGNVEKMPHMMIAGSTGTGKSVCINAILTALLYQNSPEQLRMIMVDPKRVELSTYSNIPHLLTPVIVENSKVVGALKWAVGEMEKRYQLLQETGSRDIHSYNDKIANDSRRVRTDKKTGEEIDDVYEKLPFIVIVIDELADLMAAHARDVEGLIVRLAQMARAVGIHLIVSTQRPSVEVLTGLIKANITTRIAFQVATQVDSRTILDMGGAEKLLGNGDMLYLSAESAQPRRLQGVFISEKEVKDVVKFIRNQAEKMNFEQEEDLSESLEQQLESSMGIFAGSGAEGEKDDVLYIEAKNLAIESKKISTSLLQRRLRVGYARAARLIDMLEENGVVGPAEGSKAREVLLNGEETNFENPQEDQAKREEWD